MHRFFTNPENIESEIITITGQDAYHIARSLRMAVSDGLTVSDNTGNTYECVLEKIRDDECVCRIVKKSVSESEPTVKVTLYMAYPKGDKLEVVIQKAVELGASRIVPFESSRCIKRPKADKLDKQMPRLARISQEAAKQCGRDRLPVVDAPLGFSDMLKDAVQNDLILFCYEDEDKKTLKDVLESTLPSSIAVIVGCEGGFSPEEAKLAREAGCISVSLGKRILRCETAPAYVLSAISYRYEL